jgi:hypothetical protein
VSLPPGLSFGTVSGIRRNPSAVYVLLQSELCKVKGITSFGINARAVNARSTSLKKKPEEKA